MKENFILKTDGSKHVITPQVGTKFNLEELQELVGGYIQVINLNEEQCMVVNENGKLYHLEMNAEASVIAHACHAIFPTDFIVGDAVLLQNKLLD